MDRFAGGAAGKVDPDGDKNAWGFDDVDDAPPPLPRSPTAPRILQSYNTAAQSSGSNSPRPGTASSPSSALPPRPWNFGYVPAEEKGIRRTRNVQVDVDPHAYQQRLVTRTQQSVPHFQPIRIARPPRRRKPTDGSDELTDDRSWGHWAHAGLTEEPKHPFPGRKFIFRDCPLRKAECSDAWCAKHWRRAGEAEVDGGEGEESGAVDERKDGADVEVVEDGGSGMETAVDGVGVVENMAVVRLRGASDRALKQAFERATPAYAALEKKTNKALADSTEVHKTPVMDWTESTDERAQSMRSE